MTESEEQLHRAEITPLSPHVVVDIPNQIVSVATPTYIHVVRFHGGKNWQGVLHLFQPGITTHESMTERAQALEIAGNDPGDSLVQQVRARFYNRGMMPRFIKTVTTEEGGKGYAIDADITVIPPIHDDQAETSAAPLATDPSGNSDNANLVAEEAIKPIRPKKDKSERTAKIKADLGVIMEQIEELYEGKEQYSLDEVLQQSPLMELTGAIQLAIERRLIIPEYNIHTRESFVSLTDISILYYVMFQRLYGKKHFPSTLVSVIQTTVNELIKEKRTADQEDFVSENAYPRDTSKQQREIPEREPSSNGRPSNGRYRGGSKEGKSRFGNRTMLMVCTFLQENRAFRENLAANPTMQGIFLQLKAQDDTDTGDSPAAMIRNTFHAFHRYGKAIQRLQDRIDTDSTIPPTQAELLAAWIYKEQAPELMRTFVALFSQERVRSEIEAPGLQGLAELYDNLRISWNSQLPSDREHEQIPAFLDRMQT